MTKFNVLENIKIRNMLWILFATLIILIDQISKFYANAMLPFETPLAVMSGFNLTLAYNTGAAFSLFEQYNGGQIMFFTILAITVSTYLTIWLYRLEVDSSLKLKLALSLILGGTFGNMIDRLSFGYVIDFIQLYYKSFYWPIFNVADSAITVGAILLIYGFTKSDMHSN